MVAGALKISGRKKAAIEAQLEAEGFDRMAPHRRKVRYQLSPSSGDELAHRCCKALFCFPDKMI